MVHMMVAAPAGSNCNLMVHMIVHLWGGSKNLQLAATVGGNCRNGQKRPLQQSVSRNGSLWLQNANLIVFSASYLEDLWSFHVECKNLQRRYGSSLWSEHEVKIYQNLENIPFWDSNWPRKRDLIVYKCRLNHHIVKIYNADVAFPWLCHLLR